MKEVHLFYAPDIALTNELPADEANHAIRVLRLKEGDNLLITDGKGTFYEAEIATATSKRCTVLLHDTYTELPLWNGRIELALAPTKNNDRIEWFAEKATEIGIDRIAFIHCANSERKIIKTERIEKTVVSAMKQSHKARKPEVADIVAFKQFIGQPFDGQKFIAHCYHQSQVDAIDDSHPEGQAKLYSTHSPQKPFLADELTANGSALVLIGPEGDFTLEEVRAAQAAGFRPISLGESRLRTETAALVAVHLMYISKRQQNV